MANVDGMMASYSEIDGLPVGCNKVIINDLLRKTMNFKGLLTSDGAAIWKIYDYFKFFMDEKPTLKFFIITVARNVYDNQEMLS